jgi:hypothetical protein
MRKVYVGLKMCIPDFEDLHLDCIEAVRAPDFSGHFGIFRTYKML